jgi:hypothetical protein
MGATMKFMLMVFGGESDVRAHPTGWSEKVSAFMVELDDELAHRGELVYSEVLEDGADAHLVDRHGGIHTGSLAGSSPLLRFIVVKVPDESRALEIATRMAEVMGSAVEVREVRGLHPESLKP